MGRSDHGWVEKELYRGGPKLRTFNSHCKRSLCQDRMHTLEDSMLSCALHFLYLSSSSRERICSVIFKFNFALTISVKHVQSLHGGGADQDIRLFQRSWRCFSYKFMKCPSLLILTPQNIPVPEGFFGSSNLRVQKDMLTDKVRNELLLRMTSMELSWNAVFSPVRDYSMTDQTGNLDNFGYPIFP